MCIRSLACILTLGMRRVSLFWQILLDRFGPFFRVKYHHFRICDGVRPLRMVIDFGYATNLNHRCCENRRFDDDVTLAVGTVGRPTMVSSYLLTKYERYGHHPFHYHHHGRMVAIQNLKLQE